MKKNKKIKFYLAGKVSGDDYEEVVEKFKENKECLVVLLPHKKIEIITPTELCNRNWSWLRCLIVCLFNLLKCDTLVLLDDWKESRGAKIEYKVAKMLKKEIIYFDVLFK